MFVLFHSTACEHSSMLLAELKRREVLGKVELASVEGVRAAGRALPPEVTHVPAVWDTAAGRFHIGQAAFQFLLRNPAFAAPGAAPAAPGAPQAQEGLLRPATDEMYGAASSETEGLQTYAPGGGFNIPTAAAGSAGDALYPDGYLPKVPAGGRPEDAGKLTEYPDLPSMDDIMRDRASEFA